MFFLEFLFLSKISILEKYKLTLRNSIQFNVVSKGLGSERMSFYLNEAAGDIRDLLMPTLEPAKAKL